MFGPNLEGIASGTLVRMRAPRLEEAETMASWFTDRAVTEWLVRRFVPSLEEEQEVITRWSTDQCMVAWVIEYDNRMVGISSISQIDWINSHGMTGTIIGDQSVWRRGIAKLTMLTRARFAFDEMGLNKLKSGYVEGNAGSERAQKHSGYVQTGIEHQEQLVRGRRLNIIRTELLRSRFYELHGAPE